MSIFKKFLVTLCTGFIMIWLIGCQPEGPAERGGKKVDETVEKAGEETEKAGEKIKEGSK